MVTLMFKFYSRKGKLQVKLGQIRSNFQIQNFLTKVCYLVEFCLRIPKKCHFLCTRIGNAKNYFFKNYFQKCYAITFTCFLGHCTAKNKDIALNFVYMLFVCTLITYIQVFGQLESFGFYRKLFLKNQNFEFWRQIGKNQKYYISRL